MNIEIQLAAINSFPPFIMIKLIEIICSERFY